MDLTVQLVLDTAPFEAALSAVSAAADSFGSGAAAGAADGAAAVGDGLREAAAGAEEAAGAVREAAGAADGLAASSDGAAAGAKELSVSLAEAKGGADIVSAASGMASGSLQGMAGGAVKAAAGFRALGASAAAAEKASLALAAVAAVVLAVKTAFDAASAAEQRLADTRFDNMAAGAERAAAAFSRLCELMERAAGLTKGLDDAAASAARIEQERKLAELEKERAEALRDARAGGGDENAVAAAFDARRRDLESGFEKDEAARTVHGLERDRGANADRRAALRSRLDELTDESATHTRNASYWTNMANGTIFTQRQERYVANAQRENDAAARAVAEMERLRSELENLEAEDKVLAAKLEAEKGRGAVIDLRREAAEIAAAIPPAREAEAASPGADEPAARGLGFSMPALSDRLSRIGGTVGGAGAASSVQSKQLSVAEAQKKILEDFYRGWQNRPDGTVLA